METRSEIDKEKKEKEANEKTQNMMLECRNIQIDH